MSAMLTSDYCREEKSMTAQTWPTGMIRLSMKSRLSCAGSSAIIW